jgi:two-component system sensor histidine kinase/response regulator
MPRILVVEDSPTQAEHLACVLRDAGFEVETTPDAEQANERLARQTFDLVLSDIQLPGANGFDLCRRVKADRDRLAIPVVLVTRWADPVNVLRGLEAGADGFISKGREPEEIVRRLQAVLARHVRPGATGAKELTSVVYLDQQFQVMAERRQLLDVLLSSFEDQVQLDQRRQEELTRRKQAEADILLRSQELDEANKRLLEANHALALANNELEAFSYSVSHDLRAPLRAIDGFSRILHQEYAATLSEAAQQYLQDIRANSQRMGRLIDDLLGFARLSRQPLKKQTVGPAALVRQCLEELRGERKGRCVEVQVGDLPCCQADPALLKQVFTNLLSNALKYTGKRPTALIETGGRIEADGRAGATGQCTYFVKDNGVGFDMRYADKLFGVFQRLHRAEDYDGTGVGLAIVQRIVHRHGGRVWAESQPNLGATFYFTLAAAGPCQN